MPQGMEGSQILQNLPNSESVVLDKSSGEAGSMWPSSGCDLQGGGWHSGSPGSFFLFLWFCGARVGTQGPHTR